MCFHARSLAPAPRPVVGFVTSLAVCLNAGFVVSESAHAQMTDAELNVGVRNRAHPDYDPPPISVGTFQLFPSLTLAVVYDDNIFASQNNRISDVVFDIRPQAR